MRACSSRRRKRRCSARWRRSARAASTMRRTASTADYLLAATGVDQPDSADEEAIVFTGAMDYWPNVDAVCWFVARGVAAQSSRSAPARASTSSACIRRPEVRWRSRRAARSSSPAGCRTCDRTCSMPAWSWRRVRVARGIQNKVLEAMAMGRPVVVSAAAAPAFSAVPSARLRSGRRGGPSSRARRSTLMDPQTGRKLERPPDRRVLADYDWTANLAPFDAFLRRERREPSGAMCGAPKSAVAGCAQIAPDADAPAGRTGGRAARRVSNAACRRALLAWRARAVLADDAVDGVDLGAVGDVRARLRRRSDLSLAGLARARRCWPRSRAKPCFGALLGVAAAGAVWLRRRARQRRRRIAVRDGRDDSLRGLGGARTPRRRGARHSARVPLLRGAVRRISSIPTLIDRTADFTVARDPRERRSRLSRGQLFHDPDRPLVGRRSVQRMRYLIASFMVGMPLRLPLVPLAAAARGVHRRVDRRADRRQLDARLHDRHARPPQQQPARGRRDHLIYGWVFFGLVMALLFWIGGRLARG